MDFTKFPPEFWKMLPILLIFAGATVILIGFIIRVYDGMIDKVETRLKNALQAHNQEEKEREEARRREAEAAEVARRHEAEQRDHLLRSELGAVKDQIAALDKLIAQRVSSIETWVEKIEDKLERISQSGSKGSGSRREE